MPVATSDAPRDTLSKLRIQRDAGPPRRSFIGRLFQFLVVLCLLCGVVAGSVLFAQSRGWLPDTSRITEAILAKPEVRIAVLSVEQGRSADALVVASG